MKTSVLAYKQIFHIFYFFLSLEEGLVDGLFCRLKDLNPGLQARVTYGRSIEKPRNLPHSMLNTGCPKRT